MKKTFAAVLGATVAGGLAWAALGTGAVERVHSAATQADAAARATSGTAARARATKTFDGRFRDNGPKTFIVIKARFKDGEAKAIKRMRYRANMECEITKGKVPGESGWIFRGVRVNDKRRFVVRGDNGQEPESTLVFKGRFNRKFKRVRGTFRTKQWFEEQTKPEPLPDEYCRLGRTRYSASR